MNFETELRQMRSHRCFTSDKLFLKVAGPSQFILRFLVRSLGHGNQPTPDLAPDSSPCNMGTAREISNVEPIKRSCRSPCSLAIDSGYPQSALPSHPRDEVMMTFLEFCWLLVGVLPQKTGKEQKNMLC